MSSTGGAGVINFNPTVKTTTKSGMAIEKARSARPTGTQASTANFSRSPKKTIAGASPRAGAKPAGKLLYSPRGGATKTSAGSSMFSASAVNSGLASKAKVQTVTISPLTATAVKPEAGGQGEQPRKLPNFSPRSLKKPSTNVKR